MVFNISVLKNLKTPLSTSAMQAKIDKEAFLFLISGFQTSFEFLLVFLYVNSEAHLGISHD